MSRVKPLVSEQRRYLVTIVAQAKAIVIDWLSEIELNKVITLGLPEVDDRYHVWRVPLRRISTHVRNTAITSNTSNTCSRCARLSSAPIGS